MIVKICGITRPVDAAAAVAAGADWIGINFWPGSKRYVAESARAKEIAAAAAGAVVVGVFVNQSADEIEAIAQGVPLSRVQLHGDEPDHHIRRLNAIKAYRLRSDADVDAAVASPADVLVLDAPSPGYGGSGHTFDWSLARQVIAAGRAALLAGGLSPDNVAAAVAAVRPYGVDAASGVESSPGVKDAGRMRAFVAAARGVQA